jgi:hypothetical protein
MRELICPLCRKVVYKPQTLADHHCSGNLADEIALAEERQRFKRSGSIPLPSTCMVCGQWKPCVRVIDIGWICLDCQRPTQEAQ